MSLAFEAMPLIGLWIKAQYDKASTQEEMIELVYHWLNEAERSTNTVREYWFTVSAYYLYSHLTNRSYDTKQFHRL